ncbi:site-specific integrase [Ectobacillus antri]|uniref:site-specific integrase n=1 Tax=Ectobacillus antri TaxID=2486280 RepID=UPI000F594F1E|nr:site-specific integrase [Ectobacillus antri]
MKGYIRKRGKTWSYTIDIGRDEATGKRKQKTKGGFSTKKEAQAALAKLQTEIQEGSYIETSKDTLESFLRFWLQSKKINLKESTYFMYERSIDHYIIPKIGQVRLENLKTAHLQKLYNDMSDTHSSSTIYKVHKLLNQSLKRAVEMGYIKRNPAEFTEKPRETAAPTRVWDEVQLNHFLEVCRPSRYRIAFLLAATTGMRRGEILGLRWQDIDFDNKTIHVKQTLSAQNQLILDAKTASSKRSIMLPEFTIQELLKHRLKVKQEKLSQGVAYKDLDLVACTLTGHHTCNENFWKVWNKYLKMSGLPRIRFHDLRHTHATLLLKAGVHIKVVAERLGHVNPTVTLKTYSHVLKGMQEEAAQKIDDLLFKNAK